jgi:hypothetical protein
MILEGYDHLRRSMTGIAETQSLMLWSTHFFQSARVVKDSYRRPLSMAARTTVAPALWHP